jgi:hypothetical protein
LGEKRVPTVLTTRVENMAVTLGPQPRQLIRSHAALRILGHVPQSSTGVFAQTQPKPKYFTQTQDFRPQIAGPYRYVAMNPSEDAGCESHTG